MQFVMLIYESPDAFATRNNEEYRGAWRAYHKALADAHFRVGAHLHRSGKADAAWPHLEEAVRLRPESWSFRRQAIVLSDPALFGQVAAMPEYWQAVMSLGDRLYYPPIEMRGMPPPFRRARG